MKTLTCPECASNNLEHFNVAILEKEIVHTLCCLVCGKRFEDREPRSYEAHKKEKTDGR